MEKEFVLLLNKHPGILYKVCRLYCPQEEDRRDLFQEIVLQLWKAFPTFRRESQASTWMYRIALNTAISYVRKQVRTPKQESLTKTVFQLPALEEINQDEQLGLLHRAIEQLSSIEKAVIMLHLEGKSYEEMAEILGISRSNVGVKLSRIKLKLEQKIKSLTF